MNLALHLSIPFAMRDTKKKEKKMLLNIQTFGADLLLHTWIRTQVELHEVEVGLERVGAMREVKDVLLETMLWPSK